jgi:hypothetical protein
MTQTTSAQPHRDQRPNIDHPLWCDPGSCSVGTNGTGRHESASVELPPIPPNPLGVAVRLSQGAPMSKHPQADIPLMYAALSDDEGEIFDVPMDPKMARQLGRILTHTANLSGQ